MRTTLTGTALRRVIGSCFFFFDGLGLCRRAGKKERGHLCRLNNLLKKNRYRRLRG